MFLDIFLFFFGIVLAILGANFLVDGASAIARKFHVPPLIIGMTIIAFGTSLPEFVVNVFASVQHQTDLAISNILGSNIFNLLLILGVCTLIKPLSLSSNVRKKDVPMNFLAALFIAVCGYKLFFDGLPQNELQFSDGLIFLLLFCVFLYYTFFGLKIKTEPQKEENEKESKPLKTTLYIIGGLVGLIVGGEMLVDGAKDFATHSGMSDFLIGLFIVGPGTSIPELVTSIIAVRKGKIDIAVGNVIGSNIFNIFFTLGLSAIIYKLPIIDEITPGILINIFAALALLVIVLLRKGFKLSRMQGLLFIIIYVVYIVFSAITG